MQVSNNQTNIHYDSQLLPTHVKKNSKFPRIRGFIGKSIISRSFIHYIQEVNPLYQGGLSIISRVRCQRQQSSFPDCPFSTLKSEKHGICVALDFFGGWGVVAAAAAVVVVLVLILFSFLFFFCLFVVVYVFCLLLFFRFYCFCFCYVVCLFFVGFFSCFFMGGGVRWLNTATNTMTYEYITVSC